MQDKADGDSHKKSMGEFNDEHVRQPQADDRRAVQRRTFTRWMNALLQRCDPPVEVHDLFTDIQDGRILMALLEELSGCKLLYRFRSSSHPIFRLNNISKALAFLDDRHVKLLDIDASGIADGVPSVVLNLVWSIILHFQVKEVTGGLQRRLSSSLSSLSMSGHPSSGDLSPKPRDFSSHSCSPTPSKGRKASRKPKYHGKALKTLLQWVQGCTFNFGVEVLDFGKSWRSGLAFLAMIKSINPALVDLRESLTREPRENIQLAFNIAHRSLDIPPLLELEDVLCSSPDEKSIITYVSMFLVHCSDKEENNASDVEVPAIPHFGSLESVTFGEINADEPEAKALLKGFERSSEQQLWKQWTRRPSGSTTSTSLHTNGAVTSDLSSSCCVIFSTCQSQSISEQPAGSPETSAFTKKRSKYQSVFKPPSPLDAGVVSQEIRSWMEEASGGQGYSKQKADESRFSLSSEEGIYNLSALDSDEEEAYSYILELNKEDLQPHNQLKRKVPRVEEETAEEMFLNGQLSEESKPLEVHENPKANGCKDQEVLHKQNVELDKPEAQREFDWDNNDRRSKEIANNGTVLAMQSEKDRKCREGNKEDRVVEGQSNGRGEYCDKDRRKEKSHSGYLMTHGCNKTEETTISDVEKATARGLYERCGQVCENTFEREEKEKCTMFEERKDRRERREKEEVNSVKDNEKGNQPTVFKEESFKVNENILADQPEVKGATATRINTGEDNGSKETPTLEDLTSQDEDKKEYKVKHLMDAEEVLTKDGEDRELQIKRRTLSFKKATITDHRGNKGWTPADSATSQSFRGAGSTLQSLAASCGITPLELEMLLVLWTLLYCCFILPQINL